MSEPGATSKPRRRGRRWAVRVVFVLALIALCAWFLRERIAVFLVQRAAHKAGIEVAWSSLALDGLWRVRIMDPTARRAGDLDLAADRIEVEVDLWLLARGDLGGIERLAVERLRGFAGPFQRGPKQASAKAKSFQLPSAWPHLSITTRDFEVRLPAQRRVAISDLSLGFDGLFARCTARSLSWIDGDLRTGFPLDVRGSYRGDRFEIERAAWDPRIVLEGARVDVDDAEAGLMRFEGGVFGFGGRARVQGRLDADVVYMTGSVTGLDLDALVRSYAPDFIDKAAGLLDVHWNASMPIGDPRSLVCSAEVRARDARFVRSFDELSCRIQASPRAIEITDGLLVHGDNAIRFEGSAPPLGTPACAWLERTRLFCEGVIGDVHGLLALDVGLRLKSAAPWSRSPVLASAVYAHGDVAGHVRAPSADLGAIVSAFAGSSPAEGVVDLEADVLLSVRNAARVSVDGVLVAADAQVLGHPIDTCVGRVRWNELGLSLADVSATAGANRVDVGSALVPRTFFGPCAVDRLRSISVSRVRAELDDLPALLRGQETNPTFERVRAHRLVFEGALEGGEIQVERGDFATRAGVGRIVRARIPLLRDVPSVLRDRALDLELALRFDDIAGAVAAVAPEAFAADDLPGGSIIASVRVRGHENGPAAGIDLTASDLTLRGVLLDDVNVRADLDERSLRIERAECRGSLGTFSLSGTYIFADERIVDAHLDADLVDLALLAPGRLPAGAVRAEVQANGTLGLVDAAVSIAGRDLSWKGVRVDELALEAHAVTGEWTITEARARGHGLSAALTGSVSSLAPSAATRRIDLDTLTVAATDVGVALTQRATIVQNGEAWTVDGFVLEGSAGKGRFELEHDGAHSRLDVALSAPISRATLALAGIESGDAAVEAAIVLERQGADWTGRTTGRISTLDASDPGVTDLRWDAGLRDRRVTIDELVFERGAGEHLGIASAAGYFPLDVRDIEAFAPGDLALHVELDTPHLAVLPFVRSEWGVSGGGKIRAELNGTWSSVNGSIDARLDDAAIAGVRGLAELGRITGTTKIVLAESMRLDAADISLDDTVLVRAAGSIDAPLDVRALARSDFERLRQAALDLAVRVDAEDLGPIASRLPVLRRTRGRVHADLRVTGTAAEPHYAGEATLADGEIRTTTNLPSIVALAGQVRFDGAQLVVDNLGGEMGGAPFTMQGRVGVIGDAPEIDLKLAGKSLLLWRERDVTVRADADLTLSGPIDGLVLAGDLALRESRYTKKFDFLALGRRGPKSAGTRGLRLFALEEPPFATMRFDVNVTSATPFVIATNLVRGGVSPNLSLLGTGALPELSGHVLVEPSRVLLPSGSVKVRSGRIEFRPDRPDVPDLDIQASARMQGYDIEVSIAGPYDDPRVELSSVPPLPREDLALLLITGRPPGNSLAGAVGERAALDLAVYIARDVAVAWFEADDESVESLAERLEVVVGADTTKSGSDAVLVRLRLSGDVQEDRRAIFATGERDVYDFYNFGLRFVFAFQ